MIVVLLVVIWGVALVPVTMRWLSERQLATSVARFMTARRSLRRSYPLLAVVGAEQGPGGRREPTRAVMSSDAALRARRARVTLRIARRRRVLSILASTTAFTIVFGALPPLHKLWDLSLFGIVLIGAYCAVLVRIAQHETMALGHRRPLAPASTYLGYETSALLVANGQLQPVAVRPPQRPAFVLVDAPS